MAVSPIGAAAITGFSLMLDLSGQFSTSSQVTGHVFAADYASPTPSTLTIAIADMGTAFTDAITRTPPNHINLATGELLLLAFKPCCVLIGLTGNIGGLILMPGLYSWTTAVTINSTITLLGGAADSELAPLHATNTISSFSFYSLDFPSERDAHYRQHCTNDTRWWRACSKHLLGCERRGHRRNDFAP